MELDANPRSTYGASEKYKKAWKAKYGNKEAAPTQDLENGGGLDTSFLAQKSDESSSD